MTDADPSPEEGGTIDPNAQPDEPRDNDDNPPERPESEPDELDTVLKGVDALEKTVQNHPEAANGAYANFMLGIYRAKAWQEIEDEWNRTPDWIKAFMVNRYAKYLSLGPLSAAPEAFRFMVEAGLLSAPQSTTAEQIGEEAVTDTKIMGVIAGAIATIFAPEAFPKILKLFPKLMAIAQLRQGLNESSRRAIETERTARREIDELREGTRNKVAATNNDAWTTDAAA